MNVEFLLKAEADKQSTCARCSCKLSSAGLSTSICSDCHRIAAIANEFRGNCSESMLAAMFNVDVCKRRIAHVFEQEKLGRDLDLAVLSDIEIKVKQVLDLLKEVPDKSEPIKHIYISCAEIIQLIHSRKLTNEQS